MIAAFVGTGRGLTSADPPPPDRDRPATFEKEGGEGEYTKRLERFSGSATQRGEASRHSYSTQPVQRARRANWWQQANARTNAMRCHERLPVREGLHIHQCHAPPLTGSTGCVHSHMHEIVRVARYGCRESNYTQDHSSDWRGSVTRICSARRGSTPADSVPPATDITAHRRTVAPRRTRPYTDTR